MTVPVPDAEHGLGLCAVTVTDLPFGKVPLPEAETPVAPETLQCTVPPWAVSVMPQVSSPTSMLQVLTESVPGFGGLCVGGL